MIYSCAKCNSPIALSGAHCNACGNPATNDGDSNSALLPALRIAAVVLGLGVLAWGLRVARTVHAGGTTITVSTPNQYSAFDLGTSVYSPASPVSPDGQDHVIFTKKGNTDSAHADYETYDSIDQVAQFYQAQMGPGAITKRGLLETTVKLNKDSVAGADDIVVRLFVYVPDHNPGVGRKTIIHIVHTRTLANS